MILNIDKTAASRNPIPDTEPLPDCLFGGKESLEDADDAASFWRRFMPHDVPFMKMALLDQLLHRPFHAVILEGPFDLPRLARDHARALFRSETLLARTGKPPIKAGLTITRLFFP
jgi:hypothetical protein